MADIVTDSPASILLSLLPLHHAQQPCNLVRLTFTLSSTGGPSLKNVNQKDTIPLVTVISLDVDT